MCQTSLVYHLKSSWPHLTVEICGCFFYSSFSCSDAFCLGLRRPLLPTVVGWFPVAAEVGEVSGLALRSLKHHSELQGGGWEVDVWWARSSVCGGRVTTLLLDSPTRLSSQLSLMSCGVHLINIPSDTGSLFFPSHFLFPNSCFHMCQPTSHINLCLWLCFLGYLD